MQSITKADIEQLVDWMLTAGRKRSGKPGTSLGARSVRLTLGRLKAAFEMAVDEGKLVRNVARLVTPPDYEPSEPDTWSQAEVRAFLRAATDDRTYVHASDDDLMAGTKTLAAFTRSLRTCDEPVRDWLPGKPQGRLSHPRERF